MAYNQILYLVILSLISSSLQDVTNNKVDTQDESPLADVAKEILKEKNLEHIGGMVNNFIQSGGAKQIMDGVLQNLGSNENSGRLLESLGSLLNSGGATAKDHQEQGAPKARKKSNEDVNPMELLSGLGSIVGAMQGAGAEGGQGNPAALLQGMGSLLGGGTNNGDGGTNAAALLQGIGSLLGSISQEKGRKEGGDENPAGALLQGLGSILGAAASGNQNGGSPSLLEGLGSLLGENKEGKEGGINPEMIGNMISMFASSQGEPKKETKPSKSRPPKKATSGKSRKKKVRSDSPDHSFDLSSIISMASTFLNQAGGNNVQGGSNFVDYLPMIMNTISAFTGQEAQEKANSHSGHSWALPPILERVHIYYDIFMNSDMGKQWLSYFGDQRAFKVFQDQNGNFNYNRFEELIENHSFRRHWIQQITAKLVDLLKLVSDEHIQSQYIGMGITFTNSFLKNSGFPNNALLDINRPAKSINNFAKFAAKKYLDADVDTSEYVEPAVVYVQDLLKLAKASITPGSQPKELTDKLTDTINMEIIEPITRVNRAYRFARSQPKCDRYIFCIINQDQSPSDSLNLPGLKKALYKASSLIAGWFLSSSTGTSYWDLYAVVTEEKNCQTLYHESCNGFYQEEVKATTEYIHNEL